MDPRRDQEEAIADALLAEQETSGADVPHDPPPLPQDPIEFPRVIVNNRPLREITADIVGILHTANSSPVLYVQAGQLVRLRQDERGHVWLEPVTELHLRRRLSQVADVVHATGVHAEQVWHVFPSLTLMRDVLVMESWPFPPVEGIVETPIVRPDGSLLTTPGYDALSRLIYRPAPGVTFPPVILAPTPEDIARALALLDEAIGEFPYVDDASKANALALLLTPIVRTAIAGPVPLALVDAPQAGTGKSLLTRVLALIATGRSAAIMTAPAGDEEFRKKITATLLSGTTLILLDNVEGTLLAGSLAAALTTDTWSDRILGQSAMVTLPQKVTWVATGNNLHIAGDLARRCYWIRLDAQTSRPWQRTGFRQPDLLGWVSTHRGELVTALLTLSQAWYAAGQPEAVTPTLGGFEAWTRTIGGILQHAGVVGFLGNLEDLYAQVDEGDSGQWTVWLTAWFVTYGDRPLAVAELTDDLLQEDSPVRDALPDDLADALPARESDTGRFRRKLGHALRQRVERRFGEDDLYIARGDDRHKKVALWRVRRGRERGEARGSLGPVPPEIPPSGSWPDDEAAPPLSPLNPLHPLADDPSPPDKDAHPAPEDDEPDREAWSRHPPPVHSALTTRPPVAYRLIRDSETLAQALAALPHCTVVGLDTETTGLDPLTDRLRLLQLAAPGWPVLVIDLWQIPQGTREPLHQLLASPAISKIVHHGKFDLKFLRQAGLPVQGPLCDTMLASQLLNAGLHTRRHGLAELVQHFLHAELSKEEQSSDWSGDLTPDQLQYAATDAAILLPLRDVLLAELQRAGLVEAATLEWDCLPAVAEMELYGIGVDPAHLTTLGQQLSVETAQAAATLTALLDSAPQEREQSSLFPAPMEAINLDSPSQVLHALQRLVIPVQSTAQWALAPLVESFPVVKALLDYRHARKALSLASSLPTHMHPTTGRIHATYWQLGAATGRFSCSDPNLQQIPRMVVFRRGFIAPPGYRLVIADYSQIELRVMAELSGDPRILAAYQAGEDLHSLTAALLLDKPMHQVTRDERQAAKAVNFGLIFAMGAESLRSYAQQTYGVTLTLEEATTFRTRFFEAYAGVARWQQQIRETLPMTETRTLSGRRRQWSEPPGIAALYNTPVQGGAADIVKRALAHLPQALAGTGAVIVGTIHDEILVEVLEEYAEEVARRLKTTMEQAGQGYLSRVPVIADVRIALSWATS
jgi:DNA polymerase-1